MIISLQLDKTELYNMKMAVQLTMTHYISHKIVLAVNSVSYFLSFPQSLIRVVS